MFRSRRKRAGSPTGAKGSRAYVVGDIHGRLDLLDALLDRIHEDMANRPPNKALLIFLGDLIDRGPASAQVIERLRTYRHPGVQPIFLLGNHEEVMLRALEGEASVIQSWLQFGGAECLESYGVDLGTLHGKSAEEVARRIRERVPTAHVEFLRSFHDTCRFGDYLVVHAGIRPGVELQEQLQSDLRWIREPFLNSAIDHGFVVVHGHTISEEVEERTNRIGIDTGAYRSGVLTALAIEGSKRWYLDTADGYADRTRVRG